MSDHQKARSSCGIAQWTLIIVSKLFWLSYDFCFRFLPPDGCGPGPVGEGRVLTTSDQQKGRPICEVAQWTLLFVSTLFWFFYVFSRLRCQCQGVKARPSSDASTLVTSAPCLYQPQRRPVFAHAMQPILGYTPIANTLCLDKLAVGWFYLPVKIRHLHGVSKLESASVTTKVHRVDESKDHGKTELVAISLPVLSDSVMSRRFVGFGATATHCKDHTRHTGFSLT